MSEKTVTISKQEYERLRKHKNVDQELLNNIARGIKDILQGKIKEI